jgi:hypothetical protein
MYQNTSSTYRIYSRLWCNFVFPKINGRSGRPIKSGNASGAADIEAEADKEEEEEEEAEEEDASGVEGVEGDEISEGDEMGEGQGEGEGKGKGKEKATGDASRSAQVALTKRDIDHNYQRAIRTATKYLKDNAASVLSIEALREKYSPKYARMWDHLSNADHAGIHLVYSTFLTLEGLGIFSMVLEHQGYVPFVLKKTPKGEYYVARPEGMDDEEFYRRPWYVTYTGVNTDEEKEIARYACNGEWAMISHTRVVETLRAKCEYIHTHASSSSSSSSSANADADASSSSSSSSSAKTDASSSANASSSSSSSSSSAKTDADANASSSSSSANASSSSSGGASGGAPVAYNNHMGGVIKLIMITRAGAEGISLLNVRYVHVMEPYWHMVRVEQVIGRARRICSHKDLPEELRDVRVFIYLMTVAPEMVPMLHENIRMYDVSKRVDSSTSTSAKRVITTDESLFEIMERKDAINQQILDVIKETAFDCDLQSAALGADGERGVVCFTHTQKLDRSGNVIDAGPEDRAYAYDYSKEKTDEYRQVNLMGQVKKLQMVKVPAVMVPEAIARAVGASADANMIPFAFDATSYHIYDLEQYKKGMLRRVGTLDPNTKRVSEV